MVTSILHICDGVAKECAGARERLIMLGPFLQRLLSTCGGIQMYNEKRRGIHSRHATIKGITTATQQNLHEAKLKQIKIVNLGVPFFLGSPTASPDEYLPSASDTT